MPKKHLAITKVDCLKPVSLYSAGVYEYGKTDLKYPGEILKRGIEKHYTSAYFGGFFWHFLLLQKGHHA